MEKSQEKMRFFGVLCESVRMGIVEGRGLYSLRW